MKRTFADFDRLNAAEGRLLTWWLTHRQHKLAQQVWNKAQQLSDLYHDHMTMTKGEYEGWR